MKTRSLKVPISNDTLDVSTIFEEKRGRTVDKIAVQSKHKSPSRSKSRQRSPSSRVGVDGRIIGMTYMVIGRSGETCTVHACHSLTKLVPAELIDRRQNANGNFEYYVHYIYFDKRLDEWIESSRMGSLVECSTEAVNLERVSDNRNSTPSPRAARVQRVRRAAALAGPWTQLKATSSQLNSPPITDKHEAELEEAHSACTKVKNVQRIVLGPYVMEAWYWSPYPAVHYNNINFSNSSGAVDGEIQGVNVLYLCSWCLKYMHLAQSLILHESVCSYRSPPGNLVYRHNDLAFYEMDGKDHKLYCQNLSLLSKLFLDHKSLYFDVEAFKFYVLCRLHPSCENRGLERVKNNEERSRQQIQQSKYHVSTDDPDDLESWRGAQIVGYFSKEKFSPDDYNLACLLTLPAYQKRGYGRLLIEFSYELNRIEGTSGTPERPLSDLGLVTYRAYWADVVVPLIIQVCEMSSVSSSSASGRSSRRSRQFTNSREIHLDSLMCETGIKPDDAIDALRSFGLVDEILQDRVLLSVSKINVWWKQRQPVLAHRTIHLDKKSVNWQPNK